MYKIGEIVTSKEELASYISSLENAGHTIIDCKNKKILSELDIILIQENTPNDLKVICEQIWEVKSQTNAPLWILSTHFIQINRLIYLQLGADLIIDLNQEQPDSFILQMENTIKRLKKSNGSASSTDDASESSKSNSRIELFPDSLRVTIGDQKEIQLTPLEFLALSVLVENTGKLVTYEDLFQAIWKNNDKEKAYRLNNLIFHLRKKIEVDTKNPIFIKTIRSRGYMVSI
ncbi:two-component system, OmpR family, alkaline phosphatase synthesis response regulator PhoP [Enterococcus sp. AZ170]|uniref:winged helix-turn-helix domain-containing protein n=1 Tax=Enterococcus sp. AZ170 TaxID=2774747 RepID=UPI003D2FA571